MNTTDKILVLGHRGLVGSALVRRLHFHGFHNIYTRPHSACDLGNPQDTRALFADVHPDLTILAAAHVGGIGGNMKDHVSFFVNNMEIELAVIQAAYAFKSRLVFLGSSCIYPRNAEQPFKQNALLTGPFEPTNEGYALAKVAGIKLCEWYRRERGCDFFSVIPCNLYGPGDTYSDTGHAVPMLIRKFVEAKRANARTVKLWGTGEARREFLYSDDAADGIIRLARVAELEDFLWPVNLGSGEEVSIRTLANEIAGVVGWQGEIQFDPSMPDGMPRKIMDSSYSNFVGWTPKIPLNVGLRYAVADYCEHYPL